ncbi:MAG: hypothetical protein HYZ21_13900 [Chloroflexi bacterium]|nr:hypothetical protein [Chloroflexota bacterium]
MTVFQHILWGYEMTYPDPWVHQSVQDSDAFVMTPDALDSYYFGQNAGQLLVRCEWNWARQSVEPLWNKHIGMLAGMLGAKQVGSAPWRIGQASGLEAEIVLPKKDNQRLWTGILMQDFIVIHFMVTHPKEVREQFEPAATKIISSLRFPERISGIETSSEDLPLPPGYTSVDPKSILPDISDPTPWRAYSGRDGIGALQAFYLRELPAHNWEITEYIPFPGASDLGFARIQLQRDGRQITLGIMPSETSEKMISASPANVVFKMDRT